MTTETTGPITGQRSAVQLLAALIDQHPELPNAYIVIAQPWKGAPSRLDLMPETPTGFEQWRTALGIAPASVTLHPHGRDSWVAAETVRQGSRISIAAHGIVLTHDQLSAPRHCETETAEVTA